MRFLNLIRALLFVSAIFALPAVAEAQGVARAAAQPIATGTANATIGTPLFESETITSFYVSGLTASGATLTIEASSDGKAITDSTKTWLTVNAVSTSCPTTSFTTVNADKGFRVDTGAFTDVRLRVSSTGTGNAFVSFNAIAGATLATFGCGSSGGGASTVSLTAAPSARNFPGCTVGVASAQCLAAGTAQTFVQLENTSASATVACAWGTAAVLNSATSIQLSAGQSASWGPVTAGIPSGALNCIASGATTPLYVEWN